jgi:hypothetical protein
MLEEQLFDKNLQDFHLNLSIYPQLRLHTLIPTIIIFLFYKKTFTI